MKMGRYIALIIGLIFSSMTMAAIFECKDSQGHIEYQDRECHPSASVGRDSALPKKNITHSKSYATPIENDYQLGLEAYQEQNYRKAFNLLQMAANSKHLEAQNLLGTMYLEGQGVYKDEGVACSWYRRAADLGYAPSQANLARLYHKGLGCPKDSYLAKYWYKQAVNNGDLSAKEPLAELERQTVANVEKMQMTEKHSLHDSFPTSPSSSVQIYPVLGIIKLLLLLLLFSFIMLTRIDRAKKKTTAKSFNNLTAASHAKSHKPPSKTQTEHKEQQKTITPNNQQKELSENEKQELLQAAMQWIEDEKYKKQRLPSGEVALQDGITSYEDYQKQSPNTRQLNSLLQAIEEQKKTDPLIGAKVGAKEIIQQLLHLLRDNKGVHSESMLAVLGTLAGYACQASVRQEFVANQKLPEEGIFVVATGTDGKNYYFGDYLNKPLAENQYSVWSLAAGAAQSLGVSQLLDVYEIFEYVTTTVGTETFGVPRILPERKPSDLPKDYLKYFWPTLHPIVIKFCPEPLNWPILYGFAIQNAMVLMKDVIKPNDALLVVMECAVPMSKIDIKDC